MSFRPKDSEEQAVGFSLRTAFGKGSAPVEATPNQGPNAFSVFSSLSASNAHSTRSLPSGLSNSRNALHTASAPNAPKLSFNLRSDNAPNAGQAVTAGLPTLINAFEPKGKLGQTGHGGVTVVGGSKQEAIRLMAQVDNLRERLSEAQGHSQKLQLQQNAITNAFHEAKAEFHSRLATMRDELVIAQRAEDCMRRDVDEHKRTASAARLEASAAKAAQLSESAQLSNDLSQKIDALTRERDALSRQVIEAGSKLAHAETAAATAQAASVAAEAAKAESMLQLAEAKTAAASAAAVAAADLDQATLSAAVEASTKDLKLAQERIGELSISESKLQKDVSKLEAQLQAAMDANACAAADGAVGADNLDELKKLQADVHEADMLNKQLDLKLVQVRSERDEALKRVEAAEAFVETVAAVDTKVVAETEGVRIAHVPWGGGLQQQVGALPLHLQHSPILQAGDQLFSGFSVGASPRASAEEHPMSTVHSPSAFLNEIAAAVDAPSPAAVGGAPPGAEQMVNAILEDLKAFMNESVAPKSGSSLIATVD